MLKAFNPSGIAAPASRYSHCVEVTDASRWLYISGQVGMAPDGTVPDGMAAQLDQCFANIEQALKAAGMNKGHLVKITVFAKAGIADAVSIYRSRRDLWIGTENHAPAGTYVVISELASPKFLIEVEAVAAS